MHTYLHTATCYSIQVCLLKVNICSCFVVCKLKLDCVKYAKVPILHFFLFVLRKKNAVCLFFFPYEMNQAFQANLEYVLLKNATCMTEMPRHGGNEQRNKGKWRVAEYWLRKWQIYSGRMSD